MDMIYKSLFPKIKEWLEEDDLHRNFHYIRTLSRDPVNLSLKIKSPLVLAGTDYFAATFISLGSSAEDFNFLAEYEGKLLEAGTQINFPAPMPFNLAVTGERLALNLIQHASSIATWTKKHADVANAKNIKILDTRKTTPGLRTLEKYAVRVGGGFNHRFGQTDVWMVKDNHKETMGGLKKAVQFFLDQGAFYNDLVVEIHSLEELKEAISMNVNHVMLDNFSSDTIKEAVKIKKPNMTFEVSGGISLTNINSYLIEGVDAISMGSLTYSAPREDLSLKFKKI